jgi:hypothetical protein
MFPWPNLDLTDYERLYVRPYKTNKYPGVLKRVYRVRLNNLAIEGTPFTAPQLIDNIQISRRSRIFGLMFWGDMASWRLLIRNASGETYTSFEPNTGLPPLVSAMVPGSLYNAQARIGEPPVGTNTQNQMQFGPLVIEPNWDLLPNQTLSFEGQLAAGLDPATDQRFLSIGVHVWEFPGYGEERA